MEAKMNWLVERYQNNKCEYILSNLDDNICNIIMPTGAGKSGVSFEDAMWQIDHKKDGKKLILDFSAPILKLCRQTLGDFIEVLSNTHSKLIEDGKIVFILNSSDNADGYSVTEHGIDSFHLGDIDKFYKSKRAEIAIVASCHKSMDKFVAEMPKMRDYATIVVYLDEAHLFNTTNTTHSHGGKYYEENPCLKGLCENSDYLYAMTATPDRHVVERINEYNGHSGCTYFSYKVDARELIEKNVILPPRVEVMPLNEDKVINANLLIQYMNKLKRAHPNINLKILVTCSNSKELSAIEKDLIGKRQKVYSTCSKNGCHRTNSEGEFAEEVDEINFMNEVDTHKGDCFVLHIRQLIQGIDIKSITSCVICTASHTDTETNKKHIQIIGRCLRPSMGERGKDIKDRTKKVGDVLFIMPSGFDGEGSIINFIEKYYGIGYVVGDYRKPSAEPFHKSSESEEIPSNCELTFADDEAKNNSTILLFNIEKYIKTRLLPKSKFLLKNNGKGIDIEKELKAITDNCGAFGDDWDSVVLLSKTNMQTAIKELFAKYDIVETI